MLIFALWKVLTQHTTLFFAYAAAYIVLERRRCLQDAGLCLLCCESTKRVHGARWTKAAPTTSLDFNCHQNTRRCNKAPSSLECGAVLLRIYNYQKALRCKYFAPPFARASDPNTDTSRRDVIHLFLFASPTREREREKERCLSVLRARRRLRPADSDPNTDDLISSITNKCAHTRLSDERVGYGHANLGVDRMPQCERTSRCCPFRYWQRLFDHWYLCKSLLFAISKKVVWAINTAVLHYLLLWC
jgi:hypothetical protein